MELCRSSGSVFRPGNAGQRTHVGSCLSRPQPHARLPGPQVTGTCSGPGLEKTDSLRTVSGAPDHGLLTCDGCAKGGQRRCSQEADWRFQGAGRSSARRGEWSGTVYSPSGATSGICGASCRFSPPAEASCSWSAPCRMQEKRVPQTARRSEGPFI